MQNLSASANFLYEIYALNEFEIFLHH